MDKQWWCRKVRPIVQPVKLCYDPICGYTYGCPARSMADQHTCKQVVATAPVALPVSVEPFLKYSIRIHYCCIVFVTINELEAGHLIQCITHAGHSIAFLHFTTRWSWSLTWPSGQGIIMDYSCAKFSNFSFSRFGFIVKDRHTESQMRMVAILTRPSAWVINELIN